MSKEKKKTTRAAKLSGLLSGLGAWALIYWLVCLIGVYLKGVLDIKVYGNVVIILGVIIFLLAPLFGIFVGRLVNCRWETFTKRKRIFLNSTSPLLILPIVIHLSIPHGGAGKKHVEWYDNGNKKKEVVIKNGKINGIAEGWHENGNKRFEENYKDGKKDGLQVHWYENGQKMEAINAKDGKKDGLETQWHENGNKKLEANFINDKLMDYVQWYEDGQKKSERYWVEELKSFLVNEWHENGMKKIEREWDGEDFIERRYNNKGEPIGLTIDTKAKSRVKANNP